MKVTENTPQRLTLTYNGQNITVVLSLILAFFFAVPPWGIYFCAKFISLTFHWRLPGHSHDITLLASGLPPLICICFIMPLLLSQSPVDTIIFDQPGNRILISTGGASPHKEQVFDLDLCLCACAVVLQKGPSGILPIYADLYLLIVSRDVVDAPDRYPPENDSVWVKLNSVLIGAGEARNSEACIRAWLPRTAGSDFEYAPYINAALEYLPRTAADLTPLTNPPKSRHNNPEV